MTRLARKLQAKRRGSFSIADFATMANPFVNTHPGTARTFRFLPLALLGLILAACGGNAPPPATPATPAATPSPSPAPAATAAESESAAAAPAPVPEMTVEQLIKAAGTAFGEKRYIAPPGNNAVEYYLQILAKDPKNHIADSALREMFPFATGAVEQEINGGELDEAGRVIDELAKFDPSNYTLTILRGKLDAKRKQAEHEQQVAAAAQAAAARAVADQANAAQRAAAAEQAAAEKAAAEKAAAEKAAAATPKPAAPEPVAVPATPPPPVTTPAELVKSVAPDYPPAAIRSHQQGWVEVQFTINTDGTVSGAKVLQSEPNRVFDRAALDAVRHWTFKPRMVNGVPTVEQATRRIEFKY